MGDVTGGARKKAGIKRGDVIVSYDGKKIQETATLPALVAATPVGKTVPVEVVRDGKMQSVNVTIARLNEQTAALDPQQEKGEGWRCRTFRLSSGARNLPGKDGVLVTSVVPGSPAANANVQAGDVILQVNRTPVSSVQSMKDEIAKSKETNRCCY